MKRLALLSTVLTSVMFADNPETSAIDQLATPHHFRAGVDSFWVHDHADNSLHKQTFDGFLAGPRIGYEYSIPNGVYFNLEGLYAVGRTRNSEKWRPQTSEQWKVGSHQTSIYANIESRLGRMLQYHTFSLTPFIGIGVSYFHPYANVNFYTDWFYTTAGFRANQQITKSFDLGLNVKSNFAFHARTHIRLDAKHKKSWKVNDFWGYEVGLPLTWHFGEENKWDIQFQPYYQLFDAKGQFFNLGSRLEFIFRF